MPAHPGKSLSQDDESKERTLIGVLASNDDHRPNVSLVKLFTYIYEHRRYTSIIDTNFHFLITGGTWDRIFRGHERPDVRPLAPPVASWLLGRATALPASADGGVIILSNLITQQKCSIVWPFFSPTASHWLRPENLALLRLADQWRVKRLMNRGSVMAWLDCEAQHDVNRNRQPCPPTLTLTRIGDTNPLSFEPRPASPRIEIRTALPTWKRRKLQFSSMTIALIAHNEMKQRMIEFAIDHESELAKFRTILATGTTGREVMSATTDRIHNRIRRCHSGPEGGDIEIATAILYNRCHVVIFFIDPLHPHPHIEDIRVVFQACMVRDQVIMITNEVHARDFMSRVVRERKDIEYYG
jgi:methylglyoxal synthase